MKKIFAFILATIMVMSLVPASVFAAFTAPCPAIHTTANCTDYTKVKTVAPTCTKTGYTLYVCNICGAQFTDDVKATISHSYVSDKDLAKNDLAASCLYKTSGKTHKKCSVCGAKKVDTVDWNSTSVHNLVKVSGVGCEELYECTICGEQGYKVKNALSATAAHTLEFKGIVTEPKWENGVAVSGLAIYKCKTSGCAFEKEVVVTAPACQCLNKTAIVTEKDSTCAAEGTYGVYKCDACATLWYDSNIKTGDKEVKIEKLDDKNGDKAITVADAIIAMKAHTKPAANQITVNGCTEIYTCTKCKQTVVEEKHTNVQDNIMEPIAATCITYGVNYKICTGCGYSWPELIDPLGHEEAEFIVESNCKVQGGKYSYCTREGCPVTATVPNNAPVGTPAMKIVKVELFPLDKTAHKIEYLNGDDNTSTASCTTSGLVITTCANGCAEYAVPKVEFKPATNHDWKVYRTSHNCAKSTETLSSWTSRTYYFCANCNLNTKDDYAKLGYTKPYYVDVRDTAVKTEFDSLNDAKEYHGIIARTWKLVKGELVEDTVAPRTEIKHTFIEGTKVATTCKAKGYTLYTCTGCGQIAKVWDNAPVPAHTDNSKPTAGTKATCNTAGKHTIYTCTVCKLTYYYNVKGEQVVFSGTAPAINPCGSTLKIVEGCGGAEFYFCTVCKTYYTSEACTSTVAPSEVTDHEWKTVYGGKAATCNTDGTIEVRYCADCAATEVNAVYVYGGEVIRLNFAEGNYKTAAVVATINNTLVFSKVVVVTVDTKGAVSFLCETVTTSNCPVAVNKFNHTIPGDNKALLWESAMVSVDSDSKKKDDHTSPMFTRHYCQGCDYEYIDNYVAAAAGHINSKGNLLTTACDNEGVAGGRVCVLCNKTIEVGHTYSATTTSTMTCQNDGYSYKYCTKCGFGTPEHLVVSNAKTYHNSLTADQKVVVGNVADYAHNGAWHYACPLCGVQIGDAQKGSDKGAGLEIYVNADTTTFIPGATVKVTVSLESLKGVKVWALAFPVIFDADVFEFVGYEFNTTDSAFQTFAVTEVPGGYTTFDVMFHSGKVTDGQFKDSGVLHIVANADDDTTIKAEETLVTLEFRVIAAEATKNVYFEVAPTEVASGGVLGKKLTEIYPDYAADPMFVAQYGNLYDVVVDSTEKTIAIEVLNANGQVVKTNYNGSNKSQKLEVAAFLDLDGKAGITLADAYQLYALIYNNEYDVKADANFDGKINGQDLSILYAVYTGVITIEQLIAPDAELPEGWYNGLGAK